MHDGKIANASNTTVFEVGWRKLMVEAVSKFCYFACSIPGIRAYHNALRLSTEYSSFKGTEYDHLFRKGRMTQGHETYTAHLHCACILTDINLR